MIEKWEYIAEIERIAKDAIEAEREYGHSAYDAAYEEVEWHRWVIYPANAALIPTLASSDGSSTLDDIDLHVIYRSQGTDGVISAIAFACMLDDVKERIAAMREAK